jgi:hypothetical protein
MSGHMEVEVLMTVKNIGNTKANLVGQIYCDTTCQSYHIRHFIRHNDLNREFFKIPEGTYEDYEIMPDSTYTFPLLLKVGFFDNGKFIIHAVLFYENELHQLFDTYFHAVYVAPSFEGITSDPQLFLKPNVRKRLELHEVVQLIEPPHKDSEPYSAKEREKIIEYFSKVALIIKDPTKK